jgi:hypothetical protein
LAEWQTQHSDTGLFESRALEITSYLPISADLLIAELEGLDAPPGRPVRGDGLV